MHAPVPVGPTRRGWLLIITLAAAALGGCRGCRKQRPRATPWARALPRSTAAYGLPAAADAQVTIGRRQVWVAGKPLLKLHDGRLAQGALRDGVDGLFVPRLAQALGSPKPDQPAGRVAGGRLAVQCAPAVPFRTLRAVLYTAMRAGYGRPWLVVEGAGGRRAGLPLELPAVPAAAGHGLRPAPLRPPRLAIGVTPQGLWVTRWGRADCPGGTAIGQAGGCPSLSAGTRRQRLARLTTHLRDRLRAAARQPGRRRPPSHAIMVWAGLDVTVGDFVALLDAAREGPGGGGSCRLAPDPATHHWKVTTRLWDPAGTSPQGCLYHQTVLVWSRPGHRKQ